MCMAQKLSFVVLSSLIAFPSFAATVATAKLVKGTVEVIHNNKKIVLKQEDGVEEGATIKTANKSFVKLIFIDKSQMNVGPGSEMKIEKFSGKDSGVIDMVKGTLRSQVSKDYLQQTDKDKSKMFIKTSNAVMGVRGTDFMVTTQNNQTTTVLFEGGVVFNEIGSATSGSSSQELENVVNAGVRIEPGQFSVVNAERGEPTIPASMNTQQLETLEKNANFDQPRAPSNVEGKGGHSPLPAGLDAKVAANNTEVIKTEIGKVVEVEAPARVATGNSDGFVSGSTVKPADGSFVHLESGAIIPPAQGSVYDANTGTYIADGSGGTVSKDGEYLPPKDVSINADGKFVVEVKEADGSIRKQVVAPPAPVVTSSTAVGANSIGSVAASAVAQMPKAEAPKNDILNTSFVPNALMDVTNFRQNSSGVNAQDLIHQNLNNLSEVTVRVNQ